MKDENVLFTEAACAAMASADGKRFALTAGVLLAKGVSVLESAKWLRAMDACMKLGMAEQSMFTLLRDFDCIEAGEALEAHHKLQLYFIELFERIGRVTGVPLPGGARESLVTDTRQVTEQLNRINLAAAETMREALRKAGGQ